MEGAQKELCQGSLSSVFSAPLLSRKGKPWNGYLQQLEEQWSLPEGINLYPGKINPRRLDWNPCSPHHTTAKPTDIYKPFLLTSLYPKTSRITCFRNTYFSYYFWISWHSYELILHVLKLFKNACLWNGYSLTEIREKKTYQILFTTFFTNPKS